MKRVNYDAPGVELLEVRAEAGFAASGEEVPFEQPEMQEEQEW